MTPVRTTARQRCLAYLKKNQPASASEIARALNVTPADVRHHFTGLEEDGLIEVLEFQRNSMRGRPVKLYGLNRQLLGDNISKLVDALLQEWLGGLDSMGIDDAMAGIAQRMAVNDQTTSHAPLGRRLAAAVETLNRMHYEARWEAHATGPRIILESCPYARTIASHSELCRMDRHLLKGLIRSDVDQLAKREKGMKNIPVCIFALTNPTQQ